MVEIKCITPLGLRGTIALAGAWVIMASLGGA